MKADLSFVRGPTDVTLVDGLDPHLFDDLRPIEMVRCVSYQATYLERRETPVWWPYTLKKWNQFYDKHLAAKIIDSPHLYLGRYLETPDWFDGTRDEWLKIATLIANMHDDIIKHVRNDPQAD